MKADRISGSKRVILLTDERNNFPAFHNIDANIFGKRILELKNKIILGQVDEYYYRTSGDRDALLDEQGWLHLHIAPDIDNDVLLIVEQTIDTVIFLGLVRHRIFQERPRGRSLKMALGRRLYEAKSRLSREARGKGHENDPVMRADPDEAD